MKQFMFSLPSKEKKKNQTVDVYEKNWNFFFRFTLLTKSYTLQRWDGENDKLATKLEE